MATDKTMPPNDPNSMPSPSYGGGEPSMPPGGPGGGDVMISLPKAAFDTMHQIVMQLASGLDQLANDINQQAAGAASGGGEMPADMGGMGGKMPPGESAPEDEEFLKSMMAEGNSKSR